MPERAPKAGQSAFEAGSPRPTYGLLELLFLISVFVAPLNLSLLGTSFTVYDAMTVVLIGLTIVEHRPVQYLSFKFIVAIYVFLLFALASTLRAPEPVESLTQILQFVLIFLFQLPAVVTFCRDDFMLRTSLVLLLLGTLVTTIWAYFAGQVQGAGRALVYFSTNPNALGYPTAYLLPFWMCLVFETLRRGKPARAIIMRLPVFYLLLWALGASASRSASLTTLATGLLFLTFRHGFKINPSLILRFALTLLVIGGLSYGFYQSEYFPITLRERVDRTLMGDERMTTDRLELGAAGWRAFLDSPFVGVGLDNFRYVGAQYGVMSYETTPHNIWIQFLAQIGLFGTLAFFALIVNWFVELVQAQAITTDRARAELLRAFCVSMIGIMIIHMVAPLMLQRQYWLIYGLGLALARYILDDHEQPHPSGVRQDRRSSSPGTVPAAKQTSC